MGCLIVVIDVLGCCDVVVDGEIGYLCCVCDSVSFVE